jgi:outer membrane protein
MAGHCGSIETRLVRLASMRKAARRGQISREQNMQIRNHNGLFDESKRMPQSSSAMKWLGILLAVMACGLSVRAQDTDTATLDTNVTDRAYADMTNSIAQDLKTSGTVRVMSLPDCIQVALEHNFTIKIARYNPQLARYNLWGSYGVYDPTFTASYEHDNNLSPGGIDAQGRSFTGVESESDNLDSGLAGRLPWGLNYSLGASASDQTGSRPTILATTNLTGLLTNVFFDTSSNPVVLLSPTFATRPGRSPFETTTATAGALSLSQPLLRNFWIDSDRFAIFVNKKELQKSEADFRDTLMTVITQVETAYLRLIQADENIRVQQTALELADRTLAENKKRVQVGAMAPLDEQQAEAQAAASRAALLNAEALAGTQQRVLKSLLSDNYTNQWLNIFIQPADKLVAIPQQFNLQESWRKGLAQGGSPVRLQQLRMTLEENNARVRLQRNQLFPELDLTGSYGYSGTGREFSDAFGQIQDRTAPFWSIGAQMTVPLTQTAARNNLKAAKASRDQQQLTIKLQEQNTLISIENDIATARTDYESVQATHTARLYAEAALDAEERKYENGKSTLFDILGLQAKLTTARSDEITALANYNVDLSTLSFDEGSTFERLRLDLRME